LAKANIDNLLLCHPFVQYITRQHDVREISDRSALEHYQGELIDDEIVHVQKGNFETSKYVCLQNDFSRRL